VKPLVSGTARPSLTATGNGCAPSSAGSSSRLTAGVGTVTKIPAPTTASATRPPDPAAVKEFATLIVKLAELKEQHAALATNIATLKGPRAREPRTDSAEAVDGDISSALDTDSKTEPTKLKVGLRRPWQVHIRKLTKSQSNRKR